MCLPDSHVIGGVKVDRVGGRLLIRILYRPAIYRVVLDLTDGAMDVRYTCGFAGR